LHASPAEQLGRAASSSYILKSGRERKSMAPEHPNATPWTWRSPSVTLAIRLPTRLAIHRTGEATA
jgi:hypothetical protein